MKLNVQRIIHPLLRQPGICAMTYETLRPAGLSGKTTHPGNDLNITIYKNEDLLTWVMLCPCNKTDGHIELKQRYLKPGEECIEIKEGVLDYAEKWARQNAFTHMYVYACDVSVPYYTRHSYVQEGQAVCQEGVLLYKMIKAL